MQLRGGTFASVIVGVGTLRANPLRTWLSTLGIVIGVAALVAVLSIGDGLERYAREQIESTTSVQSISLTAKTFDLVDGQRFPRADYLVFTAADADTLAARLGSRAGVMIQVSGANLVRDSAGARHALMVTGTTPETARLGGLAPAAGRFFSPAETAAGSTVGVASHRLALMLAGGGPAEAAVGDTLELQGRPVPIVGVLPPTANADDWRLYVPLDAAPALFSPTTIAQVPQLIIKAARVEDVDSVKAAAEAWLARRDPGWKERVSVATAQGRLRQAQQGMLIFKSFMGAITGISLLVGGIGIMNVLLASVVERTREIGVRKAIGARQRDVLVQFLAESVTVTGIGSMVGAGLGLAGAFATTAIIRARSGAVLYAGFSWGTVLVAAIAAVVVGLSFGIYPALRAARLSPIEAIRHE